MKNEFTYAYSKEFSCLQKLDRNGVILDAMQMPDSDLLKIAQLLKGTKDDHAIDKWRTN
jgi:hypothetical protein